MYITSIVFTLIAWGAGLLLDANIHFGDPQGFLCLRVLLPVLAMGLCLLRAIKENVLIGLTQQGTKSCKSPKYRTAEVLQ